MALDLEQLAEESTETTETPKNNEHSENVKEKTKEKKSIFDEASQILELPFEVAMQNLKVSEEDILEAGKQLFINGNFEYKLKLPFGMEVILKSKKALDEVDYYTFLYDAMQKELSMEEFRYMLNIRNLAHCIVKLGDKDMSKMTFDEKVDYLLSLPSPLIASILNQTQKFWSLMLLMMHKDFVGFLMEKEGQ